MFKRIYAISHLGTHLLWQITRRLLLRPRPGLALFLKNYRTDRIVPYRLEDKSSSFSRCISCGLCDSACPERAERAEGPVLPPFSISCLPHWIRSVPDFAGNLSSSLTRCGDCRACEAICPEGVPLKRMLLFVEEMTRRTEEGIL